jgi:hypothetical protein
MPVAALESPALLGPEPLGAAFLFHRCRNPDHFHGKA